MRSALSFLLCGCAALAACSPENALRDQVREQIVAACTSRSGETPVPGVDPQAFCNCLGDRAVAGRSIDELRELTGENGRAAGAEAGRQCVAQLSGGEAGTASEGDREAANGASGETEGEGADESK